MLDVADLKKAFGGNEVIRGFTLAVHPRSIVGLVGANGAGKSTIFNLITGFLRPDGGVVRVGGRDVLGLSPRKISRLGIQRTFQEIRIFSRLTAMENLLVAIEDRPFGFRTGGRARELAHEVLEMTGMGPLAGTMAGRLPYAEQKFLSVGRAIARQPKLLLLDEPAAGLDSRSLSRLSSLVERVRTAGTTIVIIEHNLGFVRDLADEVAFLDYGQVRARGALAEIMKRADLAEAYFGG